MLSANEAAVHRQDLTGDEGCLFGGQECYGVGDIFRLAETAQRGFLDKHLNGIIAKYPSQSPLTSTQLSDNLSLIFAIS